MLMLIGLLVFVGSVRGAFVPKIFNGEDANIEDYPYQVSVQYKGSHICGGSIISTTRILTAAHCTSDSISRMTIRAGTTIIGQGGQVREVSEIHTHPDFGNNDLAVIVLSEPLVLNNQVQIVQLAVHDNQPIGSQATITGWGRTENSDENTMLHKLDQAKMSDQTCQIQFGTTYNSTSQVCYQGEPTTSTCRDDDGGPLVQNGVQVGIAAYSYCGKTSPTRYTKVSYYLPYIQSLM